MLASVLLQIVYIVEACFLIICMSVHSNRKINVHLSAASDRKVLQHFDRYHAIMISMDDNEDANDHNNSLPFWTNHANYYGYH